MVEVNVASDSSVSEEGEEVQTIVTDSDRSLEKISGILSANPR